MGVAVVDTFVWQGLASVAIPGFTINRLCAASLALLGTLTRWPLPLRRWTTTALGLAAIPFIITPIDRYGGHAGTTTPSPGWSAPPPWELVPVWAWDWVGEHRVTQGQGKYGGTWSDPGAGGSSPQRGFAGVQLGHGPTGMELAGAGAELGLAR